MADVVSQKRLMDYEIEEPGEGEIMHLQKRATPITFEQQIIDLIKEESVKDNDNKEEIKQDVAIYNSLSIEIQEDNETQYEKEGSKCSQSLPESLPESQPQSQSQSQPQSLPESQSQSQQQSLESVRTLDAGNHQGTIKTERKVEQDCKYIIEEVYRDCDENLKNFFNDEKIKEINNEFKKKLFNDKYLQIAANIATTGKFILEIRLQDGRLNEEKMHFSLFTKDSQIRGLHLTLPRHITSSSSIDKKYSHLYIGHTVAEDSCGAADAPNKFIRIVLKSMGTYFETQMSIQNEGVSAKASIINFIKDLKLTSDERQAIGELLKYIGEKYKEHFKPPAATSGGMKIMKYNKVVEKSTRKINNKDSKNTLVNDKELKINKIKDKIKILKQDKIKNKDKIIKQIKLIEDIKTKIKIEKERAKQKHKEKTSVSKTPKTTTAKPKTPKTTTAKPKTTTAKPKTTTAKPKTTTAKPKTTTAKPKTTTAKPKTTTAKPKTPKRQANKGVL